MKKISAYLLLILICLGYGAEAQTYTWTPYYAPVASYISQGNYLWGVTGNNLIQFDKNTGYYNRIKIPDSVFICNAHQNNDSPSTPNLAMQNGYPFINNVSFDGQNWGVIPYQNNTLSPGPTFYKTINDSSGNYYFFSDSLGMMIYNGSSYVLWDTINIILNTLYPGELAGGYGLLSYDPMSFDTAGNLWIALEEYGVLKFDGHNFTLYDTNAIGAHYQGNDFFVPSGMFVNLYNNNVYVTTAGQGDSMARCYIYNGNNWKIDTLPYSFGTYEIAAMFFVANTPYFCTWKGISTYNGSSYNWANLPASLTTTGDYNVYLSGVDYGGLYWLTVNGILTRFDGTSFTPYPDTLSVLYDNYVLDQEFDHSGNLWIGTEQSIVKNTPAGFQILPSTINNGALGTMAFDSLGRLWHYNINSSGINYYDTTDHVDTPCSLFGINGIARDKNGMIWAVANNGVGMFSGLTFNAVTLPGIPAQGATCVVVDTNNNKWFGMNGGVVKFNGTTAFTFDTSNSPVPDSIECISVDPQNRIWVGTNAKGLMVYNGATWTVYNTSNSGIQGNRIEEIYFKNGNAYVCTQDNGFGIFNGTSWQTFTNRNAPLDNDCETGVVDNNCNIWIGQECGLMKLSGVCGLNPDDHVLYGEVLMPDGSPSRSELVYLLQNDSSSSTLQPVANTYTDANGAYSFTTNLSKVYVHAVPADITATGGIMPVYEDSFICQQNAPAILMDSAIVQRNIYSVGANTQTGSNELKGVINDPQGKQVSGLRIFLMQGSVPVATAVTGMDGRFLFTGLNVGSYTIWVDKMGINNSLAPTITFTTVTNGNAICELTATQLLILTFATGISDPGYSAEIKIYPNPSIGTVNINIPRADPTALSIVDMMGRELLDYMLSPGTQQIKLPGLDNGIYVFRFQSGSQVETRKVIIRK